MAEGVSGCSQLQTALLINKQNYSSRKLESASCEKQTGERSSPFTVLEFCVSPNPLTSPFITTIIVKERLCCPLQLQRFRGWMSRTNNRNKDTMSVTHLIGYSRRVLPEGMSSGSSWKRLLILPTRRV